MRAQERLRWWRDNVAKANQRDISAAFGVRQSTWSNWENGRYKPDDATRQRLVVFTDGYVTLQDWIDTDNVAPVEPYAPGPEAA